MQRLGNIHLRWAGTTGDGRLLLLLPPLPAPVTVPQRFWLAQPDSNSLIKASHLSPYVDPLLPFMLLHPPYLALFALSSHWSDAQDALIHFLCYYTLL